MTCPMWPCVRQESLRATDRSAGTLDDRASEPGELPAACAIGLGETQCAANMPTGNSDSGRSRRDDVAGG